VFPPRAVPPSIEICVVEVPLVDGVYVPVDPPRT